MRNVERLLLLRWKRKLGRLFLLRRKRRRIDRDGLRLLHLLQLRNQLRVQFYAVPALRTHDDRYHLNRTNAV